MDIWLNMNGGYERKIDSKLNNFQLKVLDESVYEEQRESGFFHRAKTMFNVQGGSKNTGKARLLDRKVIGKSGSKDNLPNYPTL